MVTGLMQQLVWDEVAKMAWLTGTSFFAVTRLGCGTLDYREQAQQIELKTGGMTVSAHVLPDGSHLDTYEQVCCLHVTQHSKVYFSSIFSF